MRGARRQEQQHGEPAHRRTLSLVAAGIAWAGCHYDVGEADSAFYRWDDRQVHCAIDIDSYARISTDSIATGLDRARDRGEVLELYTHNPGTTVDWSAIEAVLASAQQRGLAFVTYGDLARGTIAPTGGLALSFDDAYVTSWLAGRDLFERYGARLTFFISSFDTMSDEYRAGLHQLAADGHDIEAHSVGHYRGPRYVEERGLGEYISQEIAPSIDHLRDDGFDVAVFAYPYGARTNETDRAILDHVKLLRSVTFTWDSPATDPCPE